MGLIGTAESVDLALSQAVGLIMGTKRLSSWVALSIHSY